MRRCISLSIPISLPACLYLSLSSLRRCLFLLLYRERKRGRDRDCDSVLFYLFMHYVSLSAYPCVALFLSVPISVSVALTVGLVSPSPCTDRGAKIGLWRCQRGLSRACRSPFWECKKHNNANRLLSRDCFYQLHQLRTVARSLTASATSILIHAFITSRIDYCCSLYAGFPSVRLGFLNRFMRSAAAFVGRISKLGHVSK